MTSTYQFKDLAGNDIELTFDPGQFSATPRHVLIFPLYRDQIVMTEHHDRGIELPGGKVEQNESLISAASREMWEETGAVLDGLLRIGEYRICAEHEEPLIKAVFLGYVHHFEPLPQGYETRGYHLFPLSVDVEGPAFSPFVKDPVFEYTRSYVVSKDWRYFYEVGNYPEKHA
ncbi:MAG: NUDIX domain-containing protein [Bacillaceae bacterium]|nr:NUDIX domain-containing protein [Bacillaceae bacterium]